MHNLNGLPKFVILTVSLFIFATNSPAKEVSPEEINAKECKKFVDSLFDDLSPHFPVSKYLTRENGTLNCTKEMNDNYINSLPSYATHTPHDIKNYRDENQKKLTRAVRTKNKDSLEWIAKSCVPIVDIYVDMHTEKTKGVPKADQVRYFRTKLHSVEIKTILDRIFKDMTYKMLDEIYSGAAPITDKEVADRIVLFYGECREVFERAMFLR